MSDVIKEKRAELATAIEKEIKETIIKLMDENFGDFVTKSLNISRDDQLEKIVGKDTVALMKEYRKLV